MHAARDTSFPAAWHIDTKDEYEAADGLSMSVARRNARVAKLISAAEMTRRRSGPPMPADEMRTNAAVAAVS